MYCWVGLSTFDENTILVVFSIVTDWVTKDSNEHGVDQRSERADPQNLASVPDLQAAQPVYNPFQLQSPTRLISTVFGAAAVRFSEQLRSLSQSGGRFCLL
jgi:hypothetical protein